MQVFSIGRDMTQSVEENFALRAVGIDGVILHTRSRTFLIRFDNMFALSALA